MNEQALEGKEQSVDNRIRVFLGIPHTGTLAAALVTNILAMMNDPHYRVLYYPIGHRRPVDAARNEIVDLFLQSDCEYLLMIDADMADDTDYQTQPRFLELAKLGKDIIGALGLMWKDEEGVIPNILDYDEKEEGLKIKRTFVIGDIVEADAIGSGVMMIHRRVLEKLDPPYFKYVYDDKGMLALGQDFFFCQKAKEAGFRIYTYTGILTSHYQNINLLDIFKRQFNLSPQSQAPANPNIRKLK